MRVGGRHYRTIERASDTWAIDIIDQTRLPHHFETQRLETLEQAATAIRDMQVRGAPLIGATAAYGVCLALREDASDDALRRSCDTLNATRPTGINLAWALKRMRRGLSALPEGERVQRAYELADAIADEDVSICEAIGRHGMPIIQDIHEARGDGRTVNILTHCNAGWLATVDWGTALAPVYKAHNAGIPVHVWVDETRPRNQGASLTAWELLSHGVDHTVVVDNAGGHLMQTGKVDMVITGSDRTTAGGGVFNKIGTYLKALAAHDNAIPFYVGLPGPTIDWEVGDDATSVPIEERPLKEVTEISGRDTDGSITSVRLTPDGSDAANPAFDFTPARLVTGLITERGVCEASGEGLLSLYSERRAHG